MILLTFWAFFVLLTLFSMLVGQSSFRVRAKQKARVAPGLSADSSLLLSCSSREQDRPARARKQGPALASLLKSANVLAFFVFCGTLSAQTGFIGDLYQETALGTSAPFNNINPKYQSWTVMYNYTTGGTGDFSVELDCAPDATTPGGTPTPGAFTACANTGTGTNPSTQALGLYGYITFVGYTPWLKTKINSIGGGSITVIAVGFNPSPPDSLSSGGGGCAGTASTPCVVAGPNAPGAASTKNPVQVAGNDGTDVQSIKTDTSGRTQVVGASAVGVAPAGDPVPVANVDGGGLAIIPTYCTLSAPVSLTTSGLTQLVALSAGKQIRICHISIAFATAETFQLEEGTGSVCAGGTAALTGVYQAVLTLALDFPSGTLNALTSNALCANLGSSVVGGGVILYALY